MHSQPDRISIYNDVGSAELMAVGSMIRRARNLKKLYMHSIEQKSSGIDIALDNELSDALQSHPSLCIIHISFTYPAMRPIALDYFAKACSKMPALEELCIERGESVMQSNAFPSILTPQTIQKVDIRRINIVQSVDETDWPNIYLLV